MSIDERLDRLTERHEALTQSVELVLIITRENAVAAKENAIAARENTESIRLLAKVTNRDAVDIRGLAPDCGKSRQADFGSRRWPRLAPRPD